MKHLNRISTGSSYLLQRDRVWGQPIFFTIETINSCNFCCIYCPQSDQEHHFINGRGIISLEDFKRSGDVRRTALKMLPCSGRSKGPRIQGSAMSPRQE